MNRYRVSLVALALVAALGGLVFSNMHGQRTRRWSETLEAVRKEFTDVRHISTAELASWLGDSGREAPLILDIREPGEFAVSHLPGARQISPDSDPLAELGDLPRDRPIVLYCSVGFRSSRYASRMAGAGFADVANLEGSIFQWANEGRPLEAENGGAAEKVHPYNAHWGQLLAPARRANTGD